MTARDRMVIIVVAAVAAVAGAWLLVIQPKRDQASKLGGQVTAEQTQLDTARSQVAQAQTARSTFTSDYAQLVRLGEAVPADDDVPSLIFQIQSAASASGVDFRSLQLSPSASAAPSTSGSSSSAPTLPPGVSVGAAGFPAEQFSFTFRGNFFHLADFFNHLQQFVVANNNHISVGGRLMTLNAINLGPASAGFPQIQATVSATTYVEPPSQGLTGGATPGGPVGISAAQQAANNASSSSAPAAATVTPSVK